MRKIGFIFGLHGIVFTFYTIINMVINDYFYAFLESLFDAGWLIQIFDFVLSVFLYMLIYTVVYFTYKTIVVRVKKEVLAVGGNWYHLHVKYDADGNPKPNGLRAGKTEISQDLFELHFTAKNMDYTLAEDGVINWGTDESRDTKWESWSIDWDGKAVLNTCFKAKTQEKSGGEFTDRHGIHKLEISADCSKMAGSFADEYPSSNRGKIYFFRTEKALYDFIKQKEAQKA